MSTEVVEQPTKDLFGNTIVQTPKPTVVITESAEIVVLELGDETLMSPAPELGTRYKTGTPKESLIEMLKKMRSNSSM